MIVVEDEFCWGDREFNITLFLLNKNNWIIDP